MRICSLWNSIPNATTSCFDQQSIKGDILQYWKGLIASIKNNHTFVEHSFHSICSWKTETKTSPL